MIGWHHLLNGHEFEQNQGDSKGQGSLACCSPQGHKEQDMTERLNNNASCVNGTFKLLSLSLGFLAFKTGIFCSYPPSIVSIQIIMCQKALLLLLLLLSQYSRV